MDHQYESLRSPEHIRVLELQPAEDRNAPIVCTMRQQHLNDFDKPYECISYTWQGQKLDQRLDCAGASLFVTANLFSALRRFRSRHRVHSLWADAVCINQKDVEEKSLQIPLMARIYRQAERVRVWLGDATEVEAQAIDFLARVAKTSNPKDQHIRSKGWLLAQEELSEGFELIQSFDTRFTEFFQLPWFGRRWIVQELVLNPNVMFYCGEKKMAWTTLELAFRNLPSHFSDIMDGANVLRFLREVGDLWRGWCKSEPLGNKIYELLESFHHLKCQEPKDMIYALAGLAGDVCLEGSTSTEQEGGVILVPDYCKSDEDVFKDLAFQKIASGDAFSALSYAGTSSSGNGARSLPTWTPDLRVPSRWHVLPINKEPLDVKSAHENADGSLSLTLVVYSWHTRVGDQLANLAISNVSTEQSIDVGVEDKHQVTNAKPAVVGHIYPKLDMIEPPDIIAYVRSLMEWAKAHLGIHRLVNFFPILDKLVRVQSTFELGLTRRFDPEERKRLNLSMGSPDDTSFENFVIENWDVWGKQLAAVLSERYFFVSTLVPTQMVGGGENAIVHCDGQYWGFGPGDLKVNDVIVKPSDDSGARMQRALFLRPNEDRYQVLGDGLFKFEPESPYVIRQKSVIEITLI